MLSLLHHRLREMDLHRRLRIARRKIVVIERMELPEELRRAALARVLRRIEEHLDQFTADA